MLMSFAQCGVGDQGDGIWWLADWWQMSLGANFFVVQRKERALNRAWTTSSRGRCIIAYELKCLVTDVNSQRVGIEQVNQVLIMILKLLEGQLRQVRCICVAKNGCIFEGAFAMTPSRLFYLLRNLCFKSDCDNGNCDVSCVEPMNN